MVLVYSISFMFLVFAVNGHQTSLNELENLKGELEKLKQLRKSYENRIDKLENIVKETRIEEDSGKDRLQTRADKVAPIGFSARLSHDLGHLQDDQILVFDHVLTNLGNHYDSGTGIFHCEEAGLYVFQLSIVAVPGAYVTAEIARNHQGEAWAFAMDPTNSSSGGTMVVLYLQAGDAVYARINGNHHGNEQRSITKQYTSFSGFRIE